MCECVGPSACPDGAANGTCVTQPGGFCYASVEEVDDENGLVVQDRTAGCLPPDESGLMQVSTRFASINYKLYFIESLVST